MIVVFFVKHITTMEVIHDKTAKRIILRNASTLHIANSLLIY